MTRLMEQAIEQLRQRPEADQDRLARLLLDELAEDERWVASTAAHEHKLPALIARVIAEDDAGKCIELDPDQL